MGNECCSSLAQTRNESENVQTNTQAPQQTAFAVNSPEEYDKMAVDILRNELKNDPETFILNQLLMCYMFFDDYSEEIKVLAHTTSDKAQKMNSRLVENHQKQFFMPDSVLECVNKRVKFEYSDGPKKNKIEALTSLRVFIIHDNIEIIDNTSDYSSIDKPCYRAIVEESKKNDGFLKILVQESPTKRSSNDSAYSTSSSSKYSKKLASPPNPIYNLDKPSTSQDKRDDSGMSSDTTDYIYSRITAAQTPEDIYVVEKNFYTNIQQFPSKCITSLKVKSESDSEAEDDDEDHLVTEKKRAPELFHYKNYLNSTEFMKHFTNNVFPNYLGEVLEYSENSIQTAKSIHGSIICDTTDNNACYLTDNINDNLIQYEVIPAISIPWPELIAFEWPIRQRPTVWDTSEVRPIRYEWPTSKMITEVKQLHCTVTPKGFMPKKGENPEMHLEWEVSFPKVEKFLELRMSYAQMRIFVYIVLLHKKFIEPKTHKHGLLLQHIRLLMFWECESNYKDWLEDKLGTKLKSVLRKLCNYLGKGVLPNYFIKNKNEFKNIPRMYLLPNQEVIFRILETPLPFLLAALKDLRYVSAHFYSEPNLDELRDILKQDSVFNHEVQLNELALMKAKQTIEMKGAAKKKRLTKEDKWNRKQLEIQKQAKMKKMSKEIEEEKDAKNLHKEYPSVDVNIKIRKDFKEDVARQILLITFFIKHFIKIAKKSLKLSSPNQCMFYLKQADYLAILLKDIPSEFENAEEFQSLIRLEEEMCMRKMSADPLDAYPPSTPKRNHSHQFKFRPKILQVKGIDVNMDNLNKTYTEEASGTKRRIKKKPKGKIIESGNVINTVTFAEVAIHNNSLPVHDNSDVKAKSIHDNSDTMINGLHDNDDIGDLLNNGDVAINSFHADENTDVKATSIHDNSDDIVNDIHDNTNVDNLLNNSDVINSFHAYDNSDVKAKSIHDNSDAIVNDLDDLLNNIDVATNSPLEYDNSDVKAKSIDDNSDVKAKSIDDNSDDIVNDLDDLLNTIDVATNSPYVYDKSDDIVNDNHNNTNVDTMLNNSDAAHNNLHVYDNDVKANGIHDINSNVIINGLHDNNDVNINSPPNHSDVEKHSLHDNSDVKVNNINNEVEIPSFNDHSNVKKNSNNKSVKFPPLDSKSEIVEDEDIEITAL